MFWVGISSEYVVEPKTFLSSSLSLCVSWITSLSVGLRLKILQTIVLSAVQLLAGAPRRCLCQRGEARLHPDATSVSADCSCGTRHVWLLLGTSLAKRKKKKLHRDQGQSSPHTHRTQVHEIRYRYSCEVVETRVKCQKNIPICCHGNLFRFQNLQAEVAILARRPFLFHISLRKKNCRFRMQHHCENLPDISLKETHWDF